MSRPRDALSGRRIRGAALRQAGSVTVDRDRPGGAQKEESLKDQASHVLDEARMVLPGLQALFGFQLIAVFSDRFAEVLSRDDQLLHLGAIGLVVVAIALVMTPAAYHRQVHQRTVTRGFIDLASKLIAGAMLPLMVAIAIDLYVVARAVSDHMTIGVAAGAFALAVYGALWFVLPRFHRRAR